MSPPLLSVEGLAVEFETRSGLVRALDDVTFTIDKGEIVGIVGESGSGKSVLSYALMGLLDRAGRAPRGRILFEGAELDREGREVAKLRGRELSMIFQSPRTALNPIRRVGKQIEDVLKRHSPTTGAEARRAAISALARVRIPDPERRYEAYPFELSGGMCQRVMIAMALACDPALLIADEPTTGLDVTTQAVVMDLVAEIARERRMATILITHDLALAGEYCDRILVMHAGHIVEAAPARAFPSELKHPYARRLFASTPGAAERLDDLAAIPGSLPDLRKELPPCRYRGRCERPVAVCDVGPVPLAAISPDHALRCVHPE
jgi:peptide/nickel transport system ATP-binding protein